MAKAVEARVSPAVKERRWELEFVSNKEIQKLTREECWAVMGNALTVHRRACRQVLVREIKGRLEGKIPRG